MISTSILASFETFATAAEDLEVCALVILVDGVEVLRMCENMSPQPSEAFMIRAEDYMEAEDAGTIMAILHSHPHGSSTPSKIDIAACNASNVPWMIFGLQDKSWTTLRPNEQVLPLLGREFVHGVVDCYTLIRDWYLQERGITLLNFSREDDWWVKGKNLYLDNFERAGFIARPLIDGDVDLKSLEVGDVILMCVLSNVPNHAAIYLGGNIILHHLGGRLSCKDVYGGYYMKHTTKILKYAAR